MTSTSLALSVQQSASGLTTGMVTRLAESVVTSLFNDLEALSRAATIDESWFTEVTELCVFAGGVETGFGHGRNYALAVIKQNWNSLPFSLRARYGYDFMNFARTLTGRERSTIDNYILTATVWFIKKVAPGHLVRRMERDDEGRPILDGAGNPRYTFEEFNPFMVDFSKLTILNSRATKDEMTDRLWELLVDPFYTCEDIRQAHVITPSGGVLPDVYYVVVGPGLYLQHGSTAVCLAEELNWADYETDPLVKEGIDRLLTLLGVKLDEDYIYDMQKRTYANS